MNGVSLCVAGSGKEESHDYRCPSGFVLSPGTPDLLKEDPVAFEYLYLQVTWSALPKITVAFSKMAHWVILNMSSRQLS